MAGALRNRKQSGERKKQESQCEEKRKEIINQFLTIIKLIQFATSCPIKLVAAQETALLHI